MRFELVGALAVSGIAGANIGALIEHHSQDPSWWFGSVILLTIVFLDARKVWRALGGLR